MISIILRFSANSFNTKGQRDKGTKELMWEREMIFSTLTLCVETVY